MVTINTTELKKKFDNKEDMLLIDVREPFEHEDFNIGGLLIPMGTLFENLHLIPKDKPVVVYCQKGIRSQIAIQRLQQKQGFGNLVNLGGGMDAWMKNYGKVR
jgi:adenylyltransferase/sulfurtransferase